MPNVHLSKPCQSALLLLAEALTVARKTRHLRQIDLAERIGITRQTIARMENGDPSVAIGIYLSAAWLLDVPLLGLEISSRKSLEGVSQLIQFIENQLPKRIDIKHKRPIDDNF